MPSNNTTLEPLITPQITAPPPSTAVATRLVFSAVLSLATPSDTFAVSHGPPREYAQHRPAASKMSPHSWIGVVAIRPPTEAGTEARHAR